MADFEAKQFDYHEGIVTAHLGENQGAEILTYGSSKLVAGIEWESDTTILVNLQSPVASDADILDADLWTVKAQNASAVGVAVLAVAQTSVSQVRLTVTLATNGGDYAIGWKV